MKVPDGILILYNYILLYYNIIICRRNLNLTVVLSDAAVPGVTYMPESLPNMLTSQVQVRVSGIKDPGDFWLQLNETHQLEALMIDLVIDNIYEYYI